MAKKSTQNLEGGCPFIAPEGKQRFRLFKTEDNRLMIEPVKAKFASKKDCGGYLGRKVGEKYITQRNVNRQLNEMERKLEFLDTSYPMLFVTLTTGDKDMTFDNLKKNVKHFLDKVAYDFKNYFGFIKRLELSEDSYKHAHLILFFNSKKALRKFTRPWVQKNWE